MALPPPGLPLREAVERYQELRRNRAMIRRLSPATVHGPGRPLRRRRGRPPAGFRRPARLSALVRASPDGREAAEAILLTHRC